MADLAHTLLRTVARAFYTTDHILVIDALINHSTLADNDLAHVLSTTTKPLRKLCGRLREDGLLSVQNRAERRTDGTGGYVGGIPQPGKERVTHRDWYYLNFHRAIDSIKYRMYKLNKYIDAQGMPETEKKDYVCKRCGEQWTLMEVADDIDMVTGLPRCKRCSFLCEDVVDDGSSENEGMKRLNVQFEKIETLLRQIDETTVPENDFTSALAAQKPVTRSDAHPGARTEVVDLPNSGLQSTKGLEMKPERIDVQLQDDEDVKRENAKADAAARKAKEAAQNQLPVWIAQSTISGDITVSGAKEERERKAREAHAGILKDEPSEDVKPNADEEDVMAGYWAAMAAEREKQAAEEREEDEDDDDDEDEFEDVDVSGTPAGSNGLTNGKAASTNANTSSNATDDERPAKRARSNEPTSLSFASSALANSQNEVPSDEDDDDIQFEDV